MGIFSGKDIQNKVSKCCWGIILIIERTLFPFTLYALIVGFFPITKSTIFAACLSLDSIRQLGRIGDALAVLLEHFDPKQPLTPDEEKAIRALRVMLDDIDGVKRRHNRSTIET